MKQYNTDNPFDLADSLEVRVINWPLQGEVKGFYHLNEKGKSIYINSSLPYYYQKVVCAHELGHATLHPEQNCIFLANHTLFNGGKYERHANLFTIEMLISDSKLREYDEYTLQQIAAIEKIPYELLQLKVQ